MSVEAFHRFVINGKVDRVREMLTRDKSLVIKPSSTGYIALDYAVVHNHAIIIDLLIETGCDVNKATHALEYATCLGYKLSVRALLDAGYNPNTRNKDGQTPLFHAFLHCRYTIAKWLSEAGCDASIKDKRGLTAMNMLGVGQPATTKVREQFLSLVQ